MKKREKELEREFDFTLILSDAIPEVTPEIENALHEAGCDDATLSIRCGRGVLVFSRKAKSLKDAILSAICNVNKSKIGVDVLRVDECNLVTQAEIARAIGRDRQLVHQYISGKRGPGGFPAPACELTTRNPLWYWCEVADWLWQNNLIKEDVLKDAQSVGAINAFLELQHQQKTQPQLSEEVRKSVSECRS